MLCGVVQELDEKVVGPDHDRAGGLTGGLPSGDAFRFPHDRFGASVGGLDEGGGVRDAAATSRARASLNALRRVARMRAMVAGPVGRTPRTLARVSGSGLAFAVAMSAMCGMRCTRTWDS